MFNPHFDNRDENGREITANGELSRARRDVKVNRYIMTDEERAEDKRVEELLKNYHESY